MISVFFPLKFGIRLKQKLKLGSKAGKFCIELCREKPLPDSDPVPTDFSESWIRPQTRLPSTRSNHSCSCICVSHLLLAAGLQEKMSTLYWLEMHPRPQRGVFLFQLISGIHRLLQYFLIGFRRAWGTETFRSRAPGFQSLLIPVGHRWCQRNFWISLQECSCAAAWGWASPPHIKGKTKKGVLEQGHNGDPGGSIRCPAPG